MEQVKQRIIKAIKSLGYDEEKGLEMFEAYKDVGDPRAILTAFSTDLDFRISAIRLAEEQSFHNPRTYMYIFSYSLKIQGKEYGAFHGGDVAFIHGSLENPKVGLEIDNLEEAQPLSKKIMDSWIAFAKTGNPNHEGIGEWPKYEKNNRSTMMLGLETASENDPLAKQRIAWEDIMKM
jgi:para-nitrobenzyl esterase